MTAISFLLLSSGLAMCGWHFLSASRDKISRLLGLIFFLSAGYNGILGIGSLFSVESLAIPIVAHLVLTAVALVSIYSLYYIFAPEESPRLSLIAIGVISGLGALLQPVSTFCLLFISLGATAFMFYQLFRRSQARSLKMSSLIFTALSSASVLHALIQLVASPQQSASIPFIAVELSLGLIGAAFLLWSITTTAMRGAVAIFIFFLGWWVLQYTKIANNIYYPEVLRWTNFYMLIAVWSLWFGFKFSRRSGGFKTSIGRVITFFTLGLLFQIFGQLIFGVYLNFLNINIPYPSLADIGYFGSALMYLIAILQLSRMIGINYNLKLMRPKILGFLTFITIFIVSCSVFQRNYIFAWEEPMKILLDFSYPFIQSLYAAIGLFLCFSYKNISNPRIFKKVVLISIALGAQCLADAVFTYQAGQNSWINGSFGDAIYLVAYFFMTTSILQLGDMSTITRGFSSGLQSRNMLSVRMPSNLIEKTIMNNFSNVTNLFSIIRNDIRKRPTGISGINLKTVP